MSISYGKRINLGRVHILCGGFGSEGPHYHLDNHTAYCVASVDGLLFSCKECLISSLRSKRFHSSYSAKNGAGASAGAKKKILFLLSFQFSRRTRAEPLATQATLLEAHFLSRGGSRGRVQGCAPPPPR